MSIERLCCWEHFRIRSRVPSIMPTMAGISTRVSVQRTDTGFFRCSGGMDRMASKTSEASMVLSLPPLNPTSQGLSSSK